MRQRWKGHSQAVSSISFRSAFQSISSSLSLQSTPFTTIFGSPYSAQCVQHMSQDQPSLFLFRFNCLTFLLLFFVLLSTFLKNFIFTHWEIHSWVSGLTVLLTPDSGSWVSGLTVLLTPDSGSLVSGLTVLLTTDSGSWVSGLTN